MSADHNRHMSKAIFLLFIVTALHTTACIKKVAVGKQTESLQGVWVREDSPPGRGPADTLTFSTKNGKNILSFYSAGSPGPDWPDHAETEYRFENGKLSYRNYFGIDNDFFEIESFQWITPEKSFSVKLYQIVRFMSADYRVTYHRTSQ